MWGRGRGGNDPLGMDHGITMALKIGDAKGSCEIPGWEGWIDVLAWSWGSSRNITLPMRPVKSLEKAAEKRKKIVESAGINVNALKDDSKQPAEKPESRSYGRWGRRHRDEETPDESELFEVSERTKISAAIRKSGYNSADEDDYEESEKIPPVFCRPNVQDLSFTKYIDKSTPALMLMNLCGQKGVEAVLKIGKTRQVIKKKEISEEEKKAKADKSAKEKAEGPSAVAGLDDAAPKEKSKKKGGDENDDETKGDDESEKIPEFIPYLEIVLSDSFISSISTGGSGGEDRLTENVTLTFSRFSFTYNSAFEEIIKLKKDIEKNPANFNTDELKSQTIDQILSEKKVQSISIDYDSVRAKGKHLDEFVDLQLQQRGELRDVRGMVMGYMGIK